MIYAFAKVLFIIFYRLFFRLKIRGLENIPKQGGVVLCANHTSYHDALVLGVSVKRPVHFLGKKEVFTNKFVTFILRKINAIPIDREKPKISSFKEVVKLLTNGGILGIFAQGTRTAEINANEAKSGAVFFALKGNAVIVPVKISSSYRFFSRINVSFGEPVTLDEYQNKKIKTDLLNEITHNLMSVIASL